MVDFLAVDVPVADVLAVAPLQVVAEPTTLSCHLRHAATQEADADVRHAAARLQGLL